VRPADSSVKVSYCMAGHGVKMMPSCLFLVETGAFVLHTEERELVTGRTFCIILSSGIFVKKGGVL